jgi:hypothetical protein
MLDRLAVALDRKRFLLLLDNFEHLLEAAPFVAALLARCPNIAAAARAGAAAAMGVSGD